MDKQIKRLIISEIIDSDSAISTDDGVIVYNRIAESFSSNLNVVLDFSHINFMTTAFLNAAIGQLYNSYSSNQLNQILRLENVTPNDRILFKKVIERAKQYFANKKNFEDSANSAIYGS